jgi:hypothetical protein
MVSAIGTGSWYSVPDWSSGQTASQDLSGFYADTVSDLTSAFATAASNQLSGTVNLAADAAAKRLGVKLPSSSTSTTPSASAKTSTSASATLSSSSGATSAYTNIDQFLATLDGNPPVPAASTSGTNGKFDLNSFLNSLDTITATSTSTPAAPQIPTGKNFSINSYLMTLDSIKPPLPPIVNVTS